MEIYISQNTDIAVEYRPMARAAYDLHRRIAHSTGDYLNALGVLGFKEIHDKYVDEFGSFFFMSKKAPLKQYVDEFVVLTQAIRKFDADGPTDELIEQASLYLHDHTVTNLEKKRTNWTTAYTPMNLLGWCWLMFARELLDGITYDTCPNFNECNRWLPSLTPRGRKTEWCSQYCRQRYERNLRAWEEGEDLLDQMMVKAQEYATRKGITLEEALDTLSKRGAFQDISEKMAKWHEDGAKE